MPTVSISFPVIVFHGRRSRPKISNSIAVESIHIRIDATNRNTAHEYHLKMCKRTTPRKGEGEREKRNEKLHRTISKICIGAVSSINKKGFRLHEQMNVRANGVCICIEAVVHEKQYTTHPHIFRFGQCQPCKLTANFQWCLQFQ